MFWKRKKLQGSQMHVLTQKRFEGLEEDKIAGYSNRPSLPYYPEPDWKAKEPDNKRV